VERHALRSHHGASGRSSQAVAFGLGADPGASQGRSNVLASIGGHLSATQINLLANLTAWSVNEAEKANGVFSSLFKLGRGSRMPSPCTTPCPSEVA
jgi:hypothetical protein